MCRASGCRPRNADRAKGSIVHRALLFALAALVIAGDLSTAAGQEIPAGSGHRAIVTLTEGTNLAATVSPDGGRIVMDLQGVLWGLPSSGGTARRLTDDLADPALPDWSPDGGTVAFQSYRDGNFHIWTMRPDGSGIQQLTSGPYDDREPAFSPDGRRLAFSSDRAGSYDIWVLDIASGRLDRWTDDPDEESQPTWSPDGNEIAFVRGQAEGPPERIGQSVTLTARSIEATSADATTRTLVAEDEGTIAAPSWSPDGTRVAYTLSTETSSILKISGRAVTDNEDVIPFPAEWISADELIYSADGKIRRRDLTSGMVRDIPFAARIDLDRPAYRGKRYDFDSARRRPVRGIASPVLSPEGPRIVFGALNDLWVMRIGERPRRLTDDRYLEAEPAWSPDGRFLAYSSDRAGSMDLYVRDMGTGSTRRLTSEPGAEAAASWSPDGGRIAYQDNVGTTFSIDVATGAVRELIPAAWEPGTPTWGPDGTTVAIAALKPFSLRFREGTSQILTVSPATGEQRWVDPIPFASLSNRVNSGPVWSPDGRAMAFTIGSRLWVMPVDASGQPTGPPRRLTDEVAESPSWSAGSREILYQSNGRLRLISAAGGAARTVPVDLRWRRAKAPRRQVVHAGRLWDGVSHDVRRNVDIVLRDNRIVSIVPHRKRRKGRVVDASRLTVIPGLWDAHVHQELDRSFLGGRSPLQQLAFGVTSTLSVGDPVYLALEDRESLASGVRTGPRFFATGEGLDGSRIYYDFFRPIATAAEFERELSRVGALDFDVLKTYVRLPNSYQAHAIAFGHRLGLPSWSHYWYPAMAFGMDGTSHVSATQRLGFSRTQSVAGISYSDIERLAAGAKMSMTTTLDGETLLAREPGLVDDPRVMALYTPWQLDTLREAIAEATTTDQTEARLGLAREVDVLRRIVRRGGYVLSGTDVPLGDIVGIDTQLQLRSMVWGGMTPYEALRTATAVPPAMLGISRDLGTVRPGRLADLAFVAGNPLRRIEDAANVRMVMTDGRLHTVPSMLAPYAR
jgi:Tol biopolymer transport system component